MIHRLIRPGHDSDVPYRTAMIAIHAGTCIRCHGPIAVGDLIHWEANTGAWHNGDCLMTPERRAELKRIAFGDDR